jgi:RHS repeat-associated protein
VTIGAVDKIEFYRDATLVATVTAPPYAATDTNVPAGAHKYTARAYNAQDPNTSFLVSVATPITVTGVLPAPSISFRAAGDQTTGTGASINPILPSGTQAGDFAVLIVAGRPTNTTQPAAPAGWTLRSSSLREAGTNDLKIMTFYRVLNGTDPNPTVNLPTSWQGTAAGMSAQIAVWTGVNPATPFDVADAIGNAAAASSWTPPGISTVTARAQVVSAVATSDDNALALGTPQGFTARMTGANYDTTAGGDHSVGLADKAQASAGAAAMPTWSQTLNASDTWAGITFALRPAAADIAPSVSLTGLANGATFSAPATITLTANATDSDGSVILVEFFDGATLVGTVPVIAGSSPSVTLSNVAAGTHVYTVRATDNSGAQTTSATVSVTVTGGAMQTYFIVPDHLNTTRLIQDQAGNTVWRWDQGEPFGNDMPNNNPSGAGAFDFPLRFPGQYFDRETNLAYNYFRNYDSMIGRYVESDPIGVLGLTSGQDPAAIVKAFSSTGLFPRVDISDVPTYHQPRTLNTLSLYTYVQGTPISKSDLYGLLPRGEGPCFVECNLTHEALVNGVAILCGYRCFDNPITVWILPRGGVCPLTISNRFGGGSGGGLGGL